MASMDLLLKAMQISASKKAAEEQAKYDAIASAEKAKQDLRAKLIAMGAPATMSEIQPAEYENVEKVVSTEPFKLGRKGLAKLSLNAPEIEYGGITQSQERISKPSERVIRPATVDEAISGQAEIGEVPKVATVYDPATGKTVTIPMAKKDILVNTSKDKSLERIQQESEARARGASGIAIARDKQKKIEEQNAKRQAYTKDLETFLALNAQIPRGEGLGRFKKGFETSVQALSQSTPRGRAAASYDAASKRLRVQLVRAAGDVGNINVVEQEAAEKLIPSIYDDEKTAQLKTAYLIEVGKAINSKDPNRVKQIFGTLGINYTDSNNTPQQAQPKAELDGLGLFD